MLLYKTAIQSPCFNFGRMLSCQSQTINVLFKQHKQSFVTTAHFPGNLRGSWHLHCGESWEAMPCLIMKLQTVRFLRKSQPRYLPILPQQGTFKFHMFSTLPSWAQNLLLASVNQPIKLTVSIFNIFVTANEGIFYLIDKIFKVDYVSVLFSSQLIAIISSNPMISVLHNIMWSRG